MDFANILFGGPCNRACPFCIGKQLASALRQNNLRLYPLLNQQAFVEEVRRRGIRQIVFTGTNTDPQLYRHESRLLSELRRQLPEAEFSLHSNGALALRKMEVFNQYDRVCLSIPSFDADVYGRAMGSRKVPDLGKILRMARVPVKVSCVLQETEGLADFLGQLHDLGIERVVLRRLLGDQRPLKMPEGLRAEGSYRGNPIYRWGRMEVTYWDFKASQSTSLNLFSDGTLSEHYLLTRSSARLNAIP